MITIGLLGLFVGAVSVVAQPSLVVKAYTIACGAQSPTISVASKQIVASPPCSNGTKIIYSLKNTGNQTLTLSGSYFSCDGHIWGCQTVPSSIAPDQTADLWITFLVGGGAMEGANNGTLPLSTNAGPFVLNFQGIWWADPKMRIVSGDNIEITKGSTYAFPSTYVGSPVSRAFTFSQPVPPTFPVALRVYNYSLTQIQGNCFSLIAGSFPNYNIQYGSPSTYRWRMLSSSPGTCKAVVSFNTNSSKYPTFSWTLSGTVTP